MRTKWILSVAVLSMGILPACSKTDDTATTPPPPAAPTSNAPVMPSVDSAKQSMSNAAANASAAAQNAAANAKTSMGNMMDKAKGAMSGAQDQAGDAAHPQAAAKMAKVSQYIADKKYNLADQTLKEVEANKSKFPPAMQDQMTSLRTQLDAARATPH